MAQIIYDSKGRIDNYAMRQAEKQAFYKQAQEAAAKQPLTEGVTRTVTGGTIEDRPSGKIETLKVIYSKDGQIISGTETKDLGPSSFRPGSTKTGLKQPTSIIEVKENTLPNKEVQKTGLPLEIVREVAPETFAKSQINSIRPTTVTQNINPSAYTTPQNQQFISSNKGNTLVSVPQRNDVPEVQKGFILQNLNDKNKIQQTTNTYSESTNFGFIEKTKSNLPQNIQTNIINYEQAKKDNAFLDIGLTFGEGSLIGGGVGILGKGAIAVASPVISGSANLIKTTQTGSKILGYGEKALQNKAVITGAKVLPYGIVSYEAGKTYIETGGNIRETSKSVAGGIGFIKGFEKGFDVGENLLIQGSKLSKNYVAIEKTNLQPVADVTIPTKVSVLRSQEGEIRGGTHVTMNLPKLSEDKTFTVIRFPEQTKGFRKEAEQFPLYKSLQIGQEKTPAYLGYAGIVKENPLVKSESKQILSLTRPEPKILYFEDYIRPTTKEQLSVINRGGSKVEQAKQIIEIQSRIKGSTNIPAENLLGLSVERQTTTPEGTLIKIKPSKSFTIYEQDGKLYKLKIYKAENIGQEIPILKSQSRLLKSNIKNEELILSSRPIKLISSSKILGSIPIINSKSNNSNFVSSPKQNISLGSSSNKSIPSDVFKSNPSESSKPSESSVPNLISSFSFSSKSKSISSTPVTLKSFSTNSSSVPNKTFIPSLPTIGTRMPSGGGGGSEGIKGTDKVSKRGYKYTSTLIGASLGIKQSAKSKKGVFSGLEIRGI